MKINQPHPMRSHLLVVLLFLMLGVHAFGQQAQREYYGTEAAKVVPGARYVLEGANTPYPAYVKFEKGQSIAYDAFFKWLQLNFKLDKDIDFKLDKEEKDDLGFVHFQFTQNRKGIPVDLATLNLHVRENRVVSFNGELYAIPDLPVTPTLSEAEALRNAMAATGATSFMWQNPFWEQEIKERSGDPNASYYPHGDLYWTRLAEGGFSLAYRFDVYAEDGEGARRILVDARSGQVLNAFPLESNCTSASCTDIYTGNNRTIFTDKYSGDNYRLKDDCQAATIRIRDWNSTTTSASPVEIENTTNTWNGNNNERFGGTVLWNTKESYNYFLNVHSRSSYDNANGDLEGYINAVFDCGGSCTTTDNASMSFSGGTMKVGFGSGGTLGNTWGALDIIAHEYTHAVTGSSSSLVYQGESGALNESFSDIFGDAVERRSTGTNDWLVGDDRTNGAIRSMSNPNAFGDPDTYLGTNWRNTCGGCSDFGGVHSNSGVQNYWFYLLGVGNGTVTTGTNDNGDDFSVTGIGFDAAGLIAYRNNVVKLTSGSNYAAARAGAIEAAEDLYGDCTAQVIQVKNAWYAVGVGNPGMPTFNASYTEPAVCSPASANIDLAAKQTNNQAAATYTWTAVYNGLTGGSSNCNGGCGTYIGEVLTNPGGGAKTVVYTVTPHYDGCDGPSFTVSKTYYPRPVGSNLSTSVLCSRDPFSINLQARITNSVNANFSWTVNYNGLGGGNGAGSGDFINETLSNNTGAPAAAVYTVTPTSETGDCAGSTFTVSVTVPPLLTTTALGTSNYNGFNISCFGGSDGVAEAYPVGGTPPYSYVWNDPNGQTTKVAGNLMAGTYSVVVTDANGCTASAMVTLTEPPLLTIEAGDNQTVYYGYPPAACATLSWSNVGGGVPPYTIMWSTGETTQDITVCPNVTTTYTVSITDANGCLTTDDVTVCAIDVRCGPRLNKVEICHVTESPNNLTLCVAIPAVADHLAHGDQLAACGTDHNCPPAGARSRTDFQDLLASNTLHAFPNPFSQSATINFSSSEDGRVSLRLTDLLGRTVRNLYTGTVDAGQPYQVNLDGGGLTAGMYYCLMQHPDGSITTVKLIVQ